MAKKSRLIEIMESKKSGGKSDLDALAQAIGPRILESLDIRGALFGKKGTSASGLGQVLGRAMFGAGYSATGAKKQTSIERTQRVESVKTSRSVIGMGRSLANIDKKMTLVAKNTISQNAMARDINVMRQNIGKMTKHMTGSYRTGADMHFMSSGKRDSAYNKSMGAGETASTTNTTPIAPTSAGVSFFGGIGSILTGILGGAGSIGGSVISGLLRAVPLLGIGGIIATGFLLKNIGETVDFKAFGKALGEDFSQIGDGLLEFFGFGDNGFFTNMFKTKEGDEGKPSFLRMVAGKLDNIFNTSKFTEALNGLILFIDETTKNLSKYLDEVFQTLIENSAIFVNKGISGVLSSFDLISNSFSTLAHNIQASVINWFDQNTPALLGAIGATIGGTIGSLIGGPAGAAIGAAAGLQAYYLGKFKQTTLADLQENLKTKQQDLMSLKTASETSPQSDDAEKKRQLEQEIRDIQNSIDIRTPKSFSDIKSLAKRYQDISESPITPRVEPYRQATDNESRMLSSGQGLQDRMAVQMQREDLSGLPSGFDWEKYKNTIGSIESANTYGIKNKLGFLGRFQMGAEALYDLGFVKVKNNDQLKDSKNWTGLYNVNSMEDFLNRPDVQDWAFAKYTASNYKSFKDAGVIKDGMSSNQIATILSTGGYGIGNALNFFQKNQDLQGAALKANPGGYEKYLAEFTNRWNGSTQVESVNTARYNASMFTAASETVDNAPVIINNFYNEAKQQMSEMQSKLTSSVDTNMIRDVFSQFLGARTAIGGFSGL